MSYDFLSMVKNTISEIVDYLDEHYHSSMVDFEERDEVLKIEIIPQAKFFIINKNSHLKELWYSSPLSGAYHFKYDAQNCKWISNGIEFFYLFYSEIKLITK